MNTYPRNHIHVHRTFCKTFHPDVISHEKYQQKIPESIRQAWIELNTQA